MKRKPVSMRIRLFAAASLLFSGLSMAQGFSTQAATDGVEWWNGRQGGSGSGAMESNGYSKTHRPSDYVGVGSAARPSAPRYTAPTPAPVPRSRVNSAAAAGAMLGLIGTFMEMHEAEAASARRLQEQADRLKQDAARQEMERQHRILEEKAARERAEAEADQQARQAMADPFSSGGNARSATIDPFSKEGAREGVANLVNSNRAKDRAQLRLNECRKKNNVPPGLGDDRVCAAEVAEVRKYQEYAEGWTEETLRRSRVAYADENERERRLSNASPVKPRTREIEEVGANPFEQMRDRAAQIRDDIKEKYEGAKQQFREVKEDPFGAKGITVSGK